MPAAFANAIGADSNALLMQGVASAVSMITAPIIGIGFSSKRIVADLTQGAVKGYCHSLCKPLF